ncbi:MAG TPA: carboxypeptidase regulatory-like domain-containing protein [Vicinamibacterales bacterium]|nr:carboxypeptidase regulatory-like domain-containing protein [Vicinamibacterales bacterium]
MPRSSSTLSLALVTISAFLLTIDTAGRANGRIRGRVLLEQSAAGVQPRPSVADLGMRDAPGARADQRRSVVYLDTAPRGAFEDRGEMRALMDQRDETFVPHVLAIMAGTTVEFLNSDRTYHNVFSLSRERPFDLGRYPRGKSKFVRFDRPGIVRVFCDIHSHMSAYILVFGHRYFALSDAEGRFAIDNVPPGTYTVAVWNEAFSRELRRVSVPDDGGEVELNVTLGRVAR